MHLNKLPPFSFIYLYFFVLLEVPHRERQHHRLPKTWRGEQHATQQVTFHKTTPIYRGKSIDQTKYT